MLLFRFGTGKTTAKSDPTILISDTNLNGELNLNSLTIGSTTRNNIKVKNLKVNPGYRYDLTLKLNGALRTIKGIKFASRYMEF